MIAYLTGPKMVDCTPISASATNMSTRSRCQNPMTPIAMMPISNSLMCRIRRDFSNLSASWPAVADSRTKGRMKMPAARFTSVFASNAVSDAA